MEQNNDFLKKHKKKIIWAGVPLGLILLGGFIYMNLSGMTSDNSSVLNTSIPENTKKDTVGNKSDLYSLLDDEKKQEEEGKAQFNVSDKLNTNTDPNSQADLTNRLNTEIASPDLGDSPQYNYSSMNVLPGNASVDYASNNNTSNDEESNRGFNSVLISAKEEDVEDKNPQYAQNATIMQETSCQAMVASKSKVVDGGTISMRLLEDLKINGYTIPRGTSIAGLARIDASRLMVKISSLNLKGKIQFVNLTAYDMDGLEGLKLPNNGIQRGAKQGVDAEMDRISMEAEAQMSGIGGQVVGSILRSVTNGRNGRSNFAIIPGGYKLILKGE